MGIAAYNRGSKCISDQIDSEKRSYAFDVMDRLNAIPKFKTRNERIFGDRQSVHPFCERCKISFGNEGWWLEDASDPNKTGMWYADLRDLIASWDIMIVEIGMTGSHPVYFTQNI